MGKGHKKNKSSTSPDTGPASPTPDVPTPATASTPIPTGPTTPDPTAEPINLCNIKTTTSNTDTATSNTNTHSNTHSSLATSTLAVDLPDSIPDPKESTATSPSGIIEPSPTPATTTSPIPSNSTRIRYVHGSRSDLTLDPTGTPPISPSANTGVSPVSPSAHTSAHPLAQPKRVRYVHGSRADLPLLDIAGSPQKHTFDEVGTPNTDYQPEAKRHREREGMRFEFPGPVAEKFESGKSQLELEDQVRVLRQRIERLEMERWGRVVGLEGLEGGVGETKKKMMGIEGGKAAEVGERVKRVLVREEEDLDPWRVFVAGAVCLGCAVVGGIVGAVVERGVLRRKVAEMLWGSVKGSPV